MEYLFISSIYLFLSEKVTCFLFILRSTIILTELIYTPTNDYKIIYYFFEKKAAAHSTAVLSLTRADPTSPMGSWAGVLFGPTPVRVKETAIRNHSRGQAIYSYPAENVCANILLATLSRGLPRLVRIPCAGKEAIGGQDLSWQRTGRILQTPSAGRQDR